MGLKITDTILRDAHQSQAATRMRIDDMIPGLAYLDEVGYWSLECWGGATFDACMRFLDEDPWERLRTLKKHLPKTKLQMLLRGQNVLGYRHYSDDVVDAFCAKSIENGIDVVRIFDALNDTRNMETAMKSVKKYGGICEAALSYTLSPVHNEDYFVKVAKELEQMGADTICIKDMANLLLPYDAAKLVKRLKAGVDIPIHLHTHNTTGTGDMTYLMAAQAGVDIVDCALSPMANGTAQPTTESLVATLKGTDLDTGLDLERLSKAAAHFRAVAKRLEKEGDLDPKVLHVDTNTLLYQVPGGMLSNLISQLKQAGAEDRYDEVLKEIPVVLKDFGYPPLVTPTSQIVGFQAVLNVLGGRYKLFTTGGMLSNLISQLKQAGSEDRYDEVLKEIPVVRKDFGYPPLVTPTSQIVGSQAVLNVLGGRYKMFTKESKGLLRGEYGRLPGTVDAAVQKMAIGDDPVITHRPADDLPPEMEKLREETKGMAESEEDVLSYALFPQVAPGFFERRKAARNPKPQPVAAPVDADGVRTLYVPPWMQMVYAPCTWKTSAIKNHPEGEKSFGIFLLKDYKDSKIYGILK